MDILIPKEKRSFVTRWGWLKARLLAGTGATSLYQPKPGQQPYGTAHPLTTSPVTRGNLQEFAATDELVQPLHTVCLDALRRQRRPTPLPLQAGLDIDRELKRTERRASGSVFLFTYANPPQRRLAGPRYFPASFFTL